MRYFVGLFMLAWLGGWFAGFNSLVSKVQSGEADAVFGLVIWTLGAAFALYYTYRAFRPSVSESLRLMPVQRDIRLFPPFSFRYVTSQKDAWEQMFPKKTRTELDWRRLQSLRLARRLAGTGVTANCLHPGFVTTGTGQRDGGIFASRVARDDAAAQRLWEE